MAEAEEISEQDTVYSEVTIASADGTALFVRRWQPADSPPRAHVLILHGYMEHGGRYRELAHALGRAKIASLAVDLRGHGRSAGARGFAARFADYVDDAQAALGLCETGPRFILGHSNGGVVALDFVAGRQPDVAGLMLTNPFLALTRPATGPKLWVGRAAGRYAPWLSLPAGLKSSDLSHDPVMVEAHRRDPLIFTRANAAWFREVAVAQARVRALRGLNVPLMYVYSDADPVASPQANRELAERLQVADKTVLVRPGEYHEVLNETRRAELLGALTRWVGQHL